MNQRILKIVISFVVLGLVGLAVCFVVDKDVEPEISALTTMGAVEQEESFVFSGKRPTGSNAELYKGYVIVEGEYSQSYSETLNGGKLLFKVDKQYKAKMPIKYGEYSSYFVFDNNVDAKQMLKIDELAFNDASVCKLSGRAKIAIKDYTVELIESSVFDHTSLAQVISSTPQIAEICPRQ
jgi:hypothetical protein